MKKNIRQLTGIFIFCITVYQCLWHLLLPFVMLRLWWKGRHEKAYRQNILERLGFYKHKKFVGAIWIHAVSVGETRAAAPLIQRLIEQQQLIVLTSTTPTGRQTGLDLFQTEIAQGKLLQCYVPYDFCWPVGRFMRNFKPSMALVMETEIWPSILFFSRKKFSVYLINGRLSPKSCAKFARFGHLSTTLLGLFAKILAQTPGDVAQYQSLGVTNCHVTGNLKFDVELPPHQVALGQLTKTQCGDRQIAVLASSREGEELLVLTAWQQLEPATRPLLVLVPRHVSRTADIAELLKSRGITCVQRSTLTLPTPITQDVLIGNTMGEMAVYLSLADYVIMGGTLMGTGGQNLIEPLSLGKPVILGPSIYNFSAISQTASTAGIAIQMKEGDVLEIQQELLKHLRNFQSQSQNSAAMAILCKEFAVQHQGATSKTLEHLPLHKIS